MDYDDLPDLDGLTWQQVRHVLIEEGKVTPVEKFRELVGSVDYYLYTQCLDMPDDRMHAMVEAGVFPTFKDAKEFVELSVAIGDLKFGRINE